MRKFFVRAAVLSLLLAVTASGGAASCAPVDEAVVLELVGGLDAAYSEGVITVPAGGMSDFVKGVEENINEGYRGCDICDAVDMSVGFEVDASGNILVSTEGFGKLPEYQGYIDAAARKTAMAVVPSGTNAADAVKAVYECMVENFSYDDAYFRALEMDSGSAEKIVGSAQGAYYAFVNGTGVCASLTKAFRSVVEAVPFVDGVADWEAEDPEHLKVAIIDNSTMDTAHEWAAIGSDGGWRFFDIANDIGNATKEDLRTYDGSMPYANPYMWTWYY